VRFSQKLNAKLGEFQVCFVPLSLLRGPVLIHSGIGSGSGTGIGPTSGSGSGWMGGVTSGSVPGYGSGSGAGPGGPGIGGVIEDSRRMCFFNGIMCMGCVGGGARPVIRGDLHGSKVHLMHLRWRSTHCLRGSGKACSRELSRRDRPNLGSH